jgi:hypothetical protein
VQCLSHSHVLSAISSIWATSIKDLRLQGLLSLLLIPSCAASTAPEPDIEVHVLFGQVSLMKFEKHVFSTEGAMHQDYCRLWQPELDAGSMAIHFGMLYILPEARLPEANKRACMVTGEDLSLRGRDVQTVIEHMQWCVSFKEFDEELAAADLWPQTFGELLQ